MTDTRPRLSATCDYLGEGRWNVLVYRDPKEFVIEAAEDKEQSAAFMAMDRYIAEMNSDTE